MSDRYFPLDMQYHKPPTVGCEWDVWSSAPSTSTSTSTSNSTATSAAITPAASPEKSTDVEIDTKPHINIKRIGVKFNVSSACEPCKKSHLGCDTQRPCRRCKIVGKEAFCIDLTVSRARVGNIASTDLLSPRNAVDPHSQRRATRHWHMALSKHQSPKSCLCQLDHSSLRPSTCSSSF